MADEIIYSGIGDLSLAAALSAEYILLAADRNALPNHPALQYVGDISVGAHSAVIKVPHIGLMGYNLLASTGDGSSPSTRRPHGTRRSMGPHLTRLAAPRDPRLHSHPRRPGRSPLSYGSSTDDAPRPARPADRAPGPPRL